MKMFPEFFFGTFWINDNCSFSLQSFRHIYRFQQALIYYYYIIGFINIRMYGDRFITDTIIGSNWCTHSLRSILWKPLYIFPCFKGNVCQKKCRCLCPLTTASMPSDFYCFVHSKHLFLSDPVYTQLVSFTHSFMNHVFAYSRKKSFCRKRQKLWNSSNDPSTTYQHMRPLLREENVNVYSCASHFCVATQEGYSLCLYLHRFSAATALCNFPDISTVSIKVFNRFMTCIKNI